MAFDDGGMSIDVSKGSEAAFADFFNKYKGVDWLSADDIVNDDIDVTDIPGDPYGFSFFGVVKEFAAQNPDVYICTWYRYSDDELWSETEETVRYKDGVLTTENLDIGGDDYYYEYISNVLSKELIKEMFKINDTEEEDFDENYRNLVYDIEGYYYPGEHIIELINEHFISEATEEELKVKIPEQLSKMNILGRDEYKDSQVEKATYKLINGEFVKVKNENS